MFKDYNKYFSTTLKVYLFVLVIIFIMKIVGLDYFGIDINNPTMLKINDFVTKYNLENIYYIITLYFYTYMFISISNNDNSTKAKLFSILVTIISTIMKVLEIKIANTFLIFIIEFSYLVFMCLAYNKFKDVKKVFLSTIKLLVLNTIFQLISLYLRNVQYKNINLSFLVRSILDLDYILMFLIYYIYVFNKGGVKRCGEEATLFSQKKINLKKSLLKLQKNFQNNLEKFKKKSKEEKLSLIIYIILSIIWNVTSVVIILFVAFLNDTLIECIFILTSFWLSKTSFGQPFHFDSMIKCFIVSNLSYYSLNRITTPLGISIIVPILLGVGLSYVTSKFVKKTYKPLYRGMPIEIFEETISKVVEKESIKYNICYEFYIEKVSDLSLSFKYNYSVPGIRKIRDRVNQKIKKLN